VLKGPLDPNRVEASVREGQSPGIGRMKLEVGAIRVASASLVHEGLACVDPDRETLGADKSGEVRYVIARAAADVEHAVTRTQFKRLEGRALPLMEEGVRILLVEIRDEPIYLAGRVDVAEASARDVRLTQRPPACS
jgi:hypothetical protein